ncbi:MAG: DEAD/DEAH box helicase [Treponema sp.]|nr:DEAD/DEAH box helicase [Treponema sp.]
MKNIKYIGNDIYEFSNFIVTKDAYGFDLKTTDKASDIDSIYSMNFTMLIQNESISNVGENACFSTDQIVDYYLFRDTPKKDFEKLLLDYGFPPENKTRKPYVCLEGAFSSKDSFWKILYPTSVSELGPIDALNLKREGFILYMPGTSDIYGTTNINEYRLHKLVEKINKTWKSDSQTDRYRALEELQKSAKKANAALEANYNKIKVVTPEKIVPDIQQTEYGFKITSGINIPELNQTDFNTHVETRKSVDSIYTIKSDSNENVKVLLSDEQMEILGDIKRMEKATPDEIKEFIANPPENWNDEIVDASNLYSDRVIGWNLYEPTINFNKLPSKNEWFEDANAELDEGNIKLEKNVHEKKLKKDLIIKDNEEGVDYEEENSIIFNGYKLPDIPGGYNDGYIAKTYQKEGIAWLYSIYKNKNPGCILADDMGLGKTFQILSFLQAISDEKINILIVSPTSLVNNWESEYYKFFKDIKYRIHIASKNRYDIECLLKNQIQDKESNAPNIYIASYESIRSCELYIKIQWDIVILDEAQRIKNTQTLTNKTARALKAHFRIAVTGTPVENSFSDIWAITDFTCPGLLNSHKSFKQHFGLSEDDTDDDLIEKGRIIREKLGSLFLRRLKEDNLPELPEKIFIKQSEYMPELQASVYKQVLALAPSITSITDKFRVLQKLRQVSDHYSFVPKYFTEEYDYTDTAKTLLLESILRKIEEREEKAIIFAEFIHTQEILASIISKRFGIRPQIYNGSVNLYARENMLNRFKHSEGFDVIIMSPIAAGVGLTITEANHVIHFSRHWNPAKEDQATDRAYRIGQKKTVYVYLLIGKINGIKSFDEKLDTLLSLKQSVKGAALFPSARLDINEREVMDGLF